jgi:hypothetical protein
MTTYAKYQYEKELTLMSTNDFLSTETEQKSWPDNRMQE